MVQQSRPLLMVSVSCPPDWIMILGIQWWSENWSYDWTLDTMKSAVRLPPVLKGLKTWAKQVNDPSEAWWIWSIGNGQLPNVNKCSCKINEQGKKEKGVFSDILAWTVRQNVSQFDVTGEAQSSISHVSSQNISWWHLCQIWNWGKCWKMAADHSLCGLSGYHW